MDNINFESTIAPVIGFVSHIQKSSKTKVFNTFLNGTAYTCTFNFPSTGKSQALNIVSQAFSDIEEFHSTKPHSHLSTPTTIDGLEQMLVKKSNVIG